MNKERYERYKEYYTKEYLMGPNSFVLLNELVSKYEEAVSGGRVLDMGCGQALTSIFLANETKADTVYALDLWINPTENMKRITEHELEDKVIPIYGNALEMPFAENYFDAIVSVDAYHYFGCEESVFDEKILPFVKKGGYVLLAMPGLRYDPIGDEMELLKEWAPDDEHLLFRTADWWKKHLAKNIEGQVEIQVSEGMCDEKAWEDWYATGHEYGLRDKEYMEKGLEHFINFVMVCVKKV